MNPITVPTSPETRAALEKAGWYLLDPRAIRLERWCHDEPSANIILHDNATMPIIGDDCHFFKVLEFATILGIHPEGHRIVATKTLLRAHQICDMYVNLAQVVAKVDVSCLVKDTKTTLAVALGVAPVPPQSHPSEDGGPSPSPLALLKFLYACAVNSAKVEPELERQIRQAIGEDAASGPREEE